jgi:hypothetical protein
VKGWNRIPLWLPVCCLLASGTVCASRQPVGERLQPFTAHYQIRLGSSTIGKVTATLQLTPSGDYRYQIQTLPVGPLAMLLNMEVTEISEGRIDGERVIPATYRYWRDHTNDRREKHLIFDWQAGTVSDQSAQPVRTMPVSVGAQDNFSEQLAMMLAMNGDPADLSFQTADGKHVRTYHLRVQGREVVEVAAGKLSTIKLARSRENRPAKRTLWLAPEFHYLPIRVVKEEDGHQFVMELDSVSWGDRQPRLPAR